MTALCTSYPVTSVSALLATTKRSGQMDNEIDATRMTGIVLVMNEASLW
jgi:hypothetical protein